MLFLDFAPEIYQRLRLEPTVCSRCNLYKRLPRKKPFLNSIKSIRRTMRRLRQRDAVNSKGRYYRGQNQYRFYFNRRCGTSIFIQVPYSWRNS
jgi:hypothetical protein